ncbi:Transient receptor potential cation channel subfamily A member 1 [Trichoplax sp. H2]|nr:Transient receptor potential cation channel subfamily A member 1 [Trichoplax sp. H2]|eukprot:RDD38686.1 Transient receptor potential cation channel subfamily A member 1 [Trichoplax sp. H2]
MEMLRRSDWSKTSVLFSKTKNVDAHDILQAAKSNDMLLLQQALPNEEIGTLANQLDRDRLAPLHYAARCGNAEVIECLIARGADINIKGLNNVTPLHLAARYNRYTAVKVLLMFNADIGVKDIDSNTALHYAAKGGNQKICEELLNKRPSLIDSVNADEMTPLHFACNTNHEAVCVCLIERGADILRRTADGSLPIHLAASKGNTSLMELLLTTGEARYERRENHIVECNHDGASVLHRATQCGQKEAVIFALDAGADASLRDKNGYTPLHVLAITGNCEICQILIDRRAAIDARDNEQQTPLHHAASLNHCQIGELLVKAVTITGNCEICQILIDRRAAIDARDNEQQTPLHHAASLNNCQIGELLVKAGANIDVVDAKGKTPLICGISRGRTEIVRYLLLSGSKVEGTDTEGKNCLHLAVEGSYEDFDRKSSELLNTTDHHRRTPFYYACNKGDYKIFEKMLQFQLDLDITDEDGNNCFHAACIAGRYEIIKTLICRFPGLLCSEGERNYTALHMAVANGCPFTVETLLDRGADTYRRDCSYSTPLDIACMKGFSHIVKILINYGVDINSVNKAGESGLHIAAQYGHTEIMKQLIDSGGDLSKETVRGENPLEVAIRYCQQDVVTAIVTLLREKDLLLKVGEEGITTFQSIALAMPEVAESIMDRCITKIATSDIKNKEKILVEYDCTLLEPGVTFEYAHGAPNGIGSFNALLTIAKSNRINLLEHPLSSKLLNVKWRQFGRYVYYLNLFTYILFVASLVTYVLIIEQFYKNNSGNTITFKGLSPQSSITNSFEVSSTTVTASFENSTNSNATTPPNDAVSFIQSLLIFRILIAFFSILNVIRELFQLIQERGRYFMCFENYFELALHAMVIIFIADGNTNPTTWSIGSIAIQMAVFELVIFLRKLPVIGKYVLMVRTMTRTIVKVLVIVLILVFGYAISFNMLCSRQAAFYNMPLSFIKVIDMMIGEIDYKDLFLDGVKSGKIPFPAGIVTFFLLMIFILIMPILIMNLMIGLAVGDIAEMEREASRRRLVDLILFFNSIEKGVPKFLRKNCKLIKFTCTEKGNVEVNKLDANEAKQKQYYESIEQHMNKIERILLDQQSRLETIEAKLESAGKSETPPLNEE